ncbi:hypothetical protein FQN60_014471 [Etheostoma spectabile]|uniref:Uncharacterized protein n=1 Tax=Etheostoma spectabile TaxID=54343 RepID=A0A5J5D8W3_9PERO|nr:hypothetical protein FQN60_014471 [Etheostoma spectabile]
MAGCPDEAAAVWESLRQESKKMQFSGNLYDMCSNRNNYPVASVSPHGSPNQEEISQESLRGYEILPGSSLASYTMAQYGTKMFSSHNHDPLACQVDFMLQEW